MGSVTGPGIGGAASSPILDFTPTLLDGTGQAVDLNGGRTLGRYQMLSPNLCWWESWIFINAGGTPGNPGAFLLMIPKGVKQDEPVGGAPVLRTVGTVIAVRGTPQSNTGKCTGAVTGGDLSTAFGAPPGTIPANIVTFDNVTGVIEEEAKSFGWTGSEGAGFPFDWCNTNTFLKFTGVFETND
jgi:hypothetical protein